MLKTFFVIVVIVHALIHLMGFVKAFQFADMPQLAGNITRPAGGAWLAATLLFVLGMALLAAGKT
jgi:hypothetical protein